MKIDLQQSLGFKINKTANDINSVFNHVLNEYDIAIEQRVTLEIINNEEEVSLTKIAHTLSKDKTTISRTLRTLEKKGLIQRNDSSEDRRVNFIELTPKGNETLMQSEKKASEFRTSLMSKLNKDEIQTFLLLLDKIKHGVESHRV